MKRLVLLLVLCSVLPRAVAQDRLRPHQGFVRGAMPISHSACFTDGDEPLLYFEEHLEFDGLHQLWLLSIDNKYYLIAGDNINWILEGDGETAKMKISKKQAKELITLFKYALLSRGNPETDERGYVLIRNADRTKTYIKPSFVMSMDTSFYAWDGFQGYIPPYEAYNGYTSRLRGIAAYYWSFTMKENPKYKYNRKNKFSVKYKYNQDLKKRIQRLTDDYRYLLREDLATGKDRALLDLIFSE